MSAPVIGICDTCGRGMVSGHQWRRMNAAERAELKVLNQRPKAREGECRICKEARRRRDDNALVPVTTRYSRDEMLDEWSMLVDHSQSLRANCVRIGPRLGMRPKTLEKALGRAGVHAWPTDALGWADRARDEWAS